MESKTCNSDRDKYTGGEMEGGGGAKTIMREHRHKMVVGSSQYYLVITFMAFRIENIILVS